MTIAEIASAVRGTVSTPPRAGAPELEIRAAHTSDMLSDVMANAPEDSVLITIQNHINAVAVATLAGVRVIAVCSARPVPEDMAEAARKEGVAIISTPLSQFQASAALAALA